MITNSDVKTTEALSLASFAGINLIAKVLKIQLYSIAAWSSSVDAEFSREVNSYNNSDVL